jgi:hypothetical protein
LKTPATGTEEKKICGIQDSIDEKNWGIRRVLYFINKVVCTPVFTDEVENRFVNER